MARSYVLAIPQTSIDAATLDNNFDQINPDGLDQACFLIRIINNSNITVLISYNGVDVHDTILPNETLQLEFQTNSSPNGFVAQLRKGTIVFIASETGNPGVGTIYLSGYYQEI